jgi:hypothetical protein
LKFIQRKIRALASKNLKPEEYRGVIDSRPTRIASHVEPQMKHIREKIRIIFILSLIGFLS